MIVQKSLSADILLFDMDGTLLDATVVIARIWTTWSARHGVDASHLLEASRGQRVSETVRTFAPPGIDLQAEELWLSRQAHVETLEPAALPGAVAFLAALPRDRWAVVTSAERSLAVKWLTGAGLPLPLVLIAAADVTTGKPHPAGYRLAAERLGCDTSRAIVFEDAPAGIEAARAAGAGVVGVANRAIAACPDLALWVTDFLTLSVDVDETQRITLYSRA